MNKSIVTLVAAAGVLALQVGVVEAKSIKNLLDSTQLSSFCSSAGVGSTSMVSLKLPDATSAVGSVHCEKDDLIASSDNGDVDVADADTDADEEDADTDSDNDSDKDSGSDSDSDSDNGGSGSGGSSGGSDESDGDED